MRGNNILYTACFLDYDSLWTQISHLTKGIYSRVIKNPHVTFVYKPSFVDCSLIGTKVKVQVTGYGFNSENEGLSVNVITDNKKLKLLYGAVEVPHITLTVSNKGQAVNTRYVHFSSVPAIELPAIYGVVTKDSQTILRL